MPTLIHADRHWLGFLPIGQALVPHSNQTLRHLCLFGEESRTSYAFPSEEGAPDRLEQFFRKGESYELFDINTDNSRRAAPCPGKGV